MKIEAIERTSVEGVFAVCLGLLTEDTSANPQVRVLYWETRRTNSTADVSCFKAVTEATLLPVLKKEILLYGYLSARNQAPVEDGRFHVHVWSSPRGSHSSSNAHGDQTIFGFPVDPERWTWFPSVDEGENIENPDSGNPVAQLIGNNLFIFPPISYRGIPDGVAIYAKILEEVVARLTMNPEERRKRAREIAKVAFMRGMSARVDRKITNLSTAMEEKRIFCERKKGDLVEHLQCVAEAKRVLKDDSLFRQADVVLGKEFDQLLSMPGVKRVAIGDDLMTIITDMIFCQDPRSKRWHEIGRFRIEIRWKSEVKVQFFNLCYQTPGFSGGMQAPHVFHDGRPCLGSAEETFTKLLREFRFADLALYAIQFLGSVNVGDAAGQYINKWPLAKEQPPRVVSAPVVAAVA